MSSEPLEMQLDQALSVGLDAALQVVMAPLFEILPGGATVNDTPRADLDGDAWHQFCVTTAESFPEYVNNDALAVALSDPQLMRAAIIVRLLDDFTEHVAGDRMPPHAVTALAETSAYLARYASRLLG
jgi:hypothetical protein